MCVDNGLFVFMASVFFFAFACQAAIGYQLYTEKKRSPYANPYYKDGAKRLEKGRHRNKSLPRAVSGTLQNNNLSIITDLDHSSTEIEMQTLKIE